MSDESATLRTFFGGAPITTEQRDALESTEAITSLRARVSRRAPKAVWAAVFAEVMKAANEFLEGGIPEVIASAWAHAAAIPDVADVTKHTPEELVVVPLVAHSINSTQQPYVELLVANTPLGRVSFEINLALALAGAVLTLRGGKIVELRVGSCHGTGNMSCEGVVIAKRDSSPVKLPAVMSFNGGASPTRSPESRVPDDTAGATAAAGAAPEQPAGGHDTAAPGRDRA